MNVRRSAAALAVPAALGAVAVLGTALAPPRTPTPPRLPVPVTFVLLPAGLYGRQDPKFDGVWRQSLAFLAQDTAGVGPAKSAVDWLAGQQCADGGFAAYRADTRTACEADGGEFSDATAAAVQALAVVGGRSAVVEKGLDWLRAAQNDDGGWGTGPGAATDANSTSVAVGAFAAAGQDPAKVTAGEGGSGKSPYDALLGLRLGCAAKADERGPSRTSRRRTTRQTRPTRQTRRPSRVRPTATGSPPTTSPRPPPRWP
ncbi:prenyltransferase/squalene oxidase repeat-containing protein [Streptomyces sp. M19]